MAEKVKKAAEVVNGAAKDPLWKVIIKEAWQYAAVVLGFFLLFTFILVNAKIPSGSMEKTIMTGDRLFGNRLAYNDAGPERFDIIIFKFPDDPKRLFVKRVIGLPGEIVEVRGGKVYIDGSSEPLTDSFCPEKPEAFGDGIYVVPEGCYFCMGDNRNHSNDSRFWQNKYVSMDAIVGKVGVRYWPPTRIGVVKSTIDDDKNW